MKKPIALFLSLVILFTSIPFTVAAEDNTTDREALLSLACEVFPEFASTIANDGHNSNVYSRSVHEPTLVVSETRSVSENASLTYTGYSDGSYIITSLTYTPDYDYSYSNYESSSFATSITADVEATVSDSGGVFELSGITFSLINGANDTIIDDGTSSVNNYCIINRQLTTKWNETSSSNPAFIGYNLEFQFHSGGQYYHSTGLYIYIGNNSFSVEHVKLD